MEFNAGCEVMNAQTAMACSDCRFVLSLNQFSEVTIKGSGRAKTPCPGCLPIVDSVSCNFRLHTMIIIFMAENQPAFSGSDKCSATSLTHSRFALCCPALKIKPSRRWVCSSKGSRKNFHPPIHGRVSSFLRSSGSK
jgi:hypothetical protein